MTFVMVDLEDQHLQDAASLAVDRYRALQQQVPNLPARYEDVDVLLPMLQDLCGQAPGVAALQGGRLVGYMAAWALDDFRGQRAILSPEWGNGADLPQSRRIYEEMYARVSAAWVTEGRRTHLLCQLPHDRAALEGWFWLGFGMIAADGVRDLSPAQGPAAEIDIRRAGPQDIETFLALGDALNRHLAAAPTFLPHGDNPRSEHEAWLADPAHALWLAEDATGVLGFMKQGPASTEACTIIRDEGTSSIVGAYTREDARSQGVGVALLNRVVQWASEQRYARCAVDFEPMNVLAARFWMRHFRPVSYALVRHIQAGSVR
jgi:GNAT superfamily N-acetyltransferase